MGLCHVCVVVCTAIWLSVDFTSAQATQECTWEDKAGMAGAQSEVAFPTIAAGFVACQQVCEKDARCTAINYYTNRRCEIFYKVPQLFAGTAVSYSVRICRTLAPVPTTQAQVVTTQAPVPTTQAQIVTTQAALVTTQAPVAATESAEVKTQADVVTTQAPAAATETPEPTSPVPATQTCTWEDTAGMAGAQRDAAFSLIAANIVACKQVCEKDARCTSIDYYASLRCDIFYIVPHFFYVTGVTYSLRICRALTLTTQAPLTSTQAPAVTTPLPESGPVCTRDGQGCLSSATCNTELNRCECPQGTQGDGALECAPMDNLLCIIARDPQVNTWDNSRTSIDLPCWYYVTDFTSGQCGIVVKALHELENDGMLFVSAVLVEFSAVRKDASASVTSSGPVTFKISRSIIEQAGGRNPWSGSETDIVEGVEIRKLWDAGNRFAILDFPSCGARVKFRPHVPGQNLQVLPPGLTISAPKTAQFGAQNTRYICQMPGSGPVYKTLKKQNNFSHQDLVPIHLILSTHRQIQNGGSCSALEITMTNCASRLQPIATEYCGPILTDRSIRKCILNKNYDTVEYFRSCLQWACTGEENACKNFSTYDSCDPPPHIVPAECSDSKPNKEISHTLPVPI